MNYLFLLGASLLPSCFAAAQPDAYEPVLSDSEALSIDVRSLVQYSVGHDDDGTIFRVDRLTLGGRHSQPGLIKVGHNLQEIACEELVTDYKEKEMSIRAVRLIDGKLYAFTSFYNSKSKQAYLFALHYDAANLKPVGELQLISTIDDQAGKKDGSWYFDYTPNHKQLAVTTRVFSRKGKGTGRVKVQVFDGDLEEVSTREVDLPVPDDELTLKGTRLSESGVLHMVLVTEGAFNARRSTSYGFSVFTVPATGEPLIRKYAIPGRQIWSTRTDWLKDGTLAIAGTYRNEGKKGEFTGLYLKTFTAGTLEPKIDLTLPLQEDGETYGLTAAVGEVEQKNSPDELLTNFNVRSIQQGEDGGIFLTGSKRFQRTRTRTGSGNVPMTNSYITDHYLDIQVIRFSAAGVLEWVRVVPKYSRFDRGPVNIAGYKPVVAGNRFYLLFNDNIRNAGNFTDEPRVLRSYKEVGTRLVSFDEAGNSDDFIVADREADGKNLYFAPEAYFDEERQALLSFINKRKERKLQRIQL